MQRWQIVLMKKDQKQVSNEYKKNQMKLLLYFNGK